MTTGLQQQQPIRDGGFFKSDATPQHGKAPDPSLLRIQVPRTRAPKPAH